MSKWQKVTSSDMQKYLDQLSAERELWVPYCENDKCKFVLYEKGQKVVFPDSIIHTSLKQLFFPKRRPIATFDEQSKWSVKQVDVPQEPRIVMGLHPCDAAGIEYMDRVFLKSGHKDIIYEAERGRTLLVGMVCSTMEEYCHCTDRGIRPDSTTGLDVVFVKAKDGYLFHGLTEKGKQLLKSQYLKDTKEKLEKREWPAGRCEIASPDEFMEMYDDKVWHELSDICLTCGICTFSCPTCVCFSVADEKFKGRGERVTVWDSCQLQSYSRMAGGHNARKTPASRVRNRTLDKFAYSHRRYGQISCTGCGRCVMVCPLKRSFPQLGAIVSERIRAKKAPKAKTGVGSKEG